MDKMLKVKDIQNILGIGRNNAYELVKMKGFPKIIIGTRYYIPEEEFEKWIKYNTYSKIIL